MVAAAGQGSVQPSGGGAERLFLLPSLPCVPILAWNEQAFVAARFITNEPAKQRCCATKHGLLSFGSARPACLAALLCRAGLGLRGFRQDERFLPKFLQIGQLLPAVQGVGVKIARRMRMKKNTNTCVRRT